MFGSLKFPAKKKKRNSISDITGWHIGLCLFFYYYLIKQYNGSILILNTKISLIANVLITIIIEQIVKKQATIHQN